MKKIKTQTKVRVITRTIVVLAVATLSVAGVVGGVVLNGSGIFGDCPKCECPPSATATPVASKTCEPLRENLYKPYVPSAYELDGAISKDSFILVAELNYNNNLSNTFSSWLYQNVQLTNTSTNIDDEYCPGQGQDMIYNIRNLYLQKVKDYIKNNNISWLKIYEPPIDPVVNIIKIRSASAIIFLENLKYPNDIHTFKNIALRVGTDQNAVNSGCPNGTGLGTGCVFKKGAYISNLGEVYLGDVSGSEFITGLSPNTTYYYRVASVVPAHVLTVNLSIPNQPSKTMNAPDNSSISTSYSKGTNGSFTTLAK